MTFGQASDMSEYGPLPRVSSIIDNWAPYYVARTKAVMDGTWESVNTWDGIGAGMVGIGDISDAVPADVKASALALQASLADGSYPPSPARLTSRTDRPGWATARPLTMARLPAWGSMSKASKVRSPTNTNGPQIDSRGFPRAA